MNTPDMMGRNEPLLIFDYRGDEISFETTPRSLYVRSLTGSMTHPVMLELDLTDSQVAALQHLLTDHLERNRP